MASSYRLILQSGAAMGTEYPLEKAELILGRDVNCDVVINDPEVSRRHLRLVLEGATFRIEDLGSTNGTFIRGQRLSMPALLNPGEIITLGEKVVLRFEIINSDPNATVVAQRGRNQTSPVPVSPYVVAAPSYVPPPAQSYQPIPAAPVYPMGNIPPVQGVIPPTPGTPKKTSKALIILLIIAGVIVLFCVIPMIIVDATNSYCTLFPGILNALFTGACP